MKKLYLILILLVFTSCSNNNTTWENVKTAGRYIQKSIDSLWGKDYNSEWVNSEDEFKGPESNDFISLNEKDLTFRSSDKAIPQPQKSLGEGGVPGFSNFKAPDQKSLFKTIHFSSDDHLVKDKEDLQTISNIGNYMKRNPKVHLCIEGHCDKRASAAYNMALGTRRANQIRVLLIKQGIDFNRIYTISYGKEKPITNGESQLDHKQNRRGEFKIYEKN
ncbi:MAG: hypothetical protein A2888_00755 [Chlamydiae bacterium RIFCSPLOWO2_01_FULL_28_7]|nr:MAG: hypothetical protein A2888_00755 [Chlamydiae bacterium RIFCSPLOWO2_01_FULL_28_7]